MPKAYLISVRTEGFSWPAAAALGESEARTFLSEAERHVAAFHPRHSEYWKQVNEVWGPRNPAPEGPTSSQDFKAWSEKFAAEKTRILLEWGIPEKFHKIIASVDEEDRPSLLLETVDLVS